MPVFISYHRPDAAKASAIQSYLSGRGVTAYLDLLDTDLQQVDNVHGDDPKKLDACTHLMALVSSTTAESWWVPFEIGVATGQGAPHNEFRSGGCQAA